ncbi:MAG: T9SS type A sorting domain-containing protein, partial [Bacteroidales bacterium]|nr:T9SS type A sorting domain-containing protein [Bacteroidales bacterium]
FPVHTWQMNILKVFVQSVGHDSISLNVVYNDTNSVTSRGIVYKQSTLNTWDTINVLDTNFNCTLYNLVPNSDYHIKAFVVVGSDTIYSNIITARTSWQGDGTQNNPFIINNVKDLLIISNNVMNGTTYLGQYLKMSCDIDFNSSTVDSSQFFTPIGGWTSPTTNIISRVFQGNFDGNGHKILNLTVNKPGNGNVALFGYVKDNEIKNLGVVGCTFIGKTNVAGFVGHTNNSIITNCYSKSNIHATSDEQNATAGGMVGNFYGNSVMNNCFAEGTINASGIGMNVGGLIAYNSGSTIKNSYSRNRFYVTGGNSSLVGGLVGYNYASSVYNSYSAPILFDIPQLYNVRYSCFIGNVIAGGAIVNNYYSDSLSGFPGVYTGSSSGIYPKTYSQLKHFDIISIPSSLGNSLNFDSVPPCPWTIDTLTNMNDGYPVQIWQYHYPAKPIVDNIVVYIDSAYVHTQIISGTYPVISKGIEWRHADSLSWDTINMPVTDYSTTILNLAPNTNYEIRAFASTINETYYDSVRTFTTLHTPVVFGEVITQGVTNISDSSVSLNGTLVSVGNALDNIKIGFAYSTDFNVNIDSSNVDTVEVEYYEGITDFIKTLSNLVQQNYYYYKAFIINDAGISYGDIAGFWFEGLGLNNLETNSIFINLYPNPANDRVKLEVEGLNSEADVLVYDMVGRVIQTYKINQGTKELEIDLRGYAKGVYSIKIANENIYQTKKLIVQ